MESGVWENFDSFAELVPEGKESVANEDHGFLMILAGGLDLVKAVDARGGGLEVCLDREASFGDGREVFGECWLGVHFSKESGRVENVVFRDFLRRISSNKLKKSESRWGIFCEWRRSFKESDGLKEIEKCPFLPKSITGIGLTPEIAFEKEGFSAAVHTPNAVVTATGKGQHALGSGLSYASKQAGSGFGRRHFLGSQNLLNGVRPRDDTWSERPICMSLDWIKQEE